MITTKIILIRILCKTLFLRQSIQYTHSMQTHTIQQNSVGLNTDTEAHPKI